MNDNAAPWVRRALLFMLALLVGIGLIWPGLEAIVTRSYRGKMQHTIEGGEAANRGASDIAVGVMIIAALGFFEWWRSQDE